MIRLNELAHLFDGVLTRLDEFVHLWVPVGAVAVLTTVVTVGIVTEPDRYALGVAPEQPIPYSHELHAGKLEIPCLYCHSGAARSRHAGVPPVSKCMNCHSVTKVDSPHIQKLAAAYESGEAIAWARVHDLPDHVYFDHRPHVNSGIACQECHGPIQEMEVVSRVLNMRMGKCLQCHRGERTYVYGEAPQKKGSTNCAACHR